MEEAKIENPENVEETKASGVPQKSKSQIKKEIAKQKWLEDKEKRKERQKAKKKENKEKRRLEREANPESYERRKDHPRPEGMPSPKTNKQIKFEYKKQVEEGQPIIIDCSFQDWLKDKELISLCRQIGYCHAANKKAKKPCKIIVTSFSGKIKEQLVKMGAENWGIHLEEDHYLEVFPKDQLVYLTGDATEDLWELNKDTAYIIGGLVDHNRHKFATLNQAKKEELKVIRLPIVQHVKLKSSTILSVNSVFDIMLKVSNGEGWEQACITSIPNRKKEGEENTTEGKKDDNPEAIEEEENIEEKDNIEEEQKKTTEAVENKEETA